MGYVVHLEDIVLLREKTKQTTSFIYHKFCQLHHLSTYAT